MFNVFLKFAYPQFFTHYPQNDLAHQIWKHSLPNYPPIKCSCVCNIRSIFQLMGITITPLLPSFMHTFWPPIDIWSLPSYCGHIKKQSSEFSCSNYWPVISYPQSNTKSQKYAKNAMSDFIWTGPHGLLVWRMVNSTILR